MSNPKSVLSQSTHGGVGVLIRLVLCHCQEVLHVLHQLKGCLQVLLGLGEEDLLLDDSRRLGRNICYANMLIALVALCCAYYNNTHVLNILSPKKQT